MDAVIERELLAAVKPLSPREVWLVIEYAKTLQTSPISEMSRAYLEVLAQTGASPAELVQAAHTIQRVEQRMAQSDPQDSLYDLEQRTHDYMQAWFRERGLDYKAATEEQLDEIVDDIVHRHGQSR